MGELLRIPSLIDSPRRTKDGSWKFTVETQELSGEDVAKLADLSGKFGFFLFSPNTIQLGDVPKEQAQEFKGKKSSSQRLYSVLFIYWKECTNHEIDFDTFYKNILEKLIDEWKSKLPTNY